MKARVVAYRSPYEPAPGGTDRKIVLREALGHFENKTSDWETALRFLDQQAQRRRAS